MKNSLIYASITAIAAVLICPVACHARASEMTPYAQIVLGENDMHQHSWSEAAYHFKSAIDLNYHDFQAHCDLGYVLLQTTDYVGARKQFVQALQLRPHYPAADEGLHLTFQSSADSDAYLKQLQDDASARPNDAEAAISLAEELFERGQTDNAVQEANAALKIAPNSGAVHCLLGRMAWLKGDSDTATTDLKAAVEIDKNDDDAWATLGDIAVAQRDYKAAVDDYKHAVAAFPQHREWHQKLEDTYKACGEIGRVSRESSIIASLTEPQAPVDLP